MLIIGLILMHFAMMKSVQNKEDPDSHRFIIDWIEYERL